MADPKDPRAVEKLETGIEGFDLISNGGLPKGRTTMVAGTAGSAKTIFATQFLVEGITRSRENGAFVTFEETAEDIRQNMLGFGWDIRQWEAEDRWAFVDASPQPGQETIFSGHYDLSALISRIEHGVKRVGAKRVSLDSLGAIFAQFSDSATIRGELFKIGAALKRMGVTAVVTAERTQEYGEISRHGVEEFVADNVIVLRNVLEAEKRRRTLEILKYRGASHQKGEFPFTVMPGVGIIAIPLSALEFTQRSSDARVTSGCGELDEMCGGGFFRDSLILVSGATGCGKTLMATNFIAGGAEDGERCLLFSREGNGRQTNQGPADRG